MRGGNIFHAAKYDPPSAGVLHPDKRPAIESEVVLRVKHSAPELFHALLVVKSNAHSDPLDAFRVDVCVYQRCCVAGDPERTHADVWLFCLVGAPLGK